MYVCMCVCVCVCVNPIPRKTIEINLRRKFVQLIKTFTTKADEQKQYEVDLLLYEKYTKSILPNRQGR